MAIRQNSPVHILVCLVISVAVSHSLAAPQEVTKKTEKFEFETRNNIFYHKKADFELLCDLYLPKGDGPFPCVLAIHGGAWRHGSKIQMLRHAWKLAESGYVVVSINYRHAPEYKFPAQIHDCKQAVRWIRSRSEKLKIDTEKIAVFGYSAGGHLAAMLGSTDSDDGFEGEVEKEFQKYSTRVQCVVVGGGPCDFGWIKSDAIKHWLGKSPNDDPLLYKKAAPITYVTKDDPPFFFVHGGGDSIVPTEASRKMHDRLLSLGVLSAYEVIGEKGHLATFSDLSWLDDATSFMNSQLKKADK